MKIDISPRAAGKTTRLIEWLREDPERLMLTFSHHEENRLKQLYPEVKNQIVDWDSYKNAHLNGYFKECAIDNVDLILQRQLREPLKIITMTDENTE